MAKPDWTERRFYHSGDEFFSDLIASFRRAQHSIRIETYIFEFDELTRLLLEELRQARQRGIEVQLLVDGVGSYAWIDQISQACREFEIEFRVFRPVPHSLMSLRAQLVPENLNVWHLVRKLNRRLHRKIVLIDEELSYVGSFNFTHLNSEKLMGAKAWRDTAVSWAGAALPDLVRSMRMVWKYSANRRLRLLKPQGTRGLRDPLYHALRSPFRLNQSRKDRRELTRDLVRRLRMANEKILIESAYFLPTRSVLVGLLRAARRGVRVEVILPGPSDVPLVKWAAFGLLHRLQRAQVGLNEYQGRVLHSKFIIIDDWCTVGSTNLNHRSFFHDLEAEVRFLDDESLGLLREQWQTDCASCRRLKDEDFDNTPWFRRLLSMLAFRMRYVL